MLPRAADTLAAEAVGRVDGEHDTVCHGEKVGERSAAQPWVSRRVHEMQGMAQRNVLHVM
jgi:hypothetical protein